MDVLMLAVLSKILSVPGALLFAIFNMTVLNMSLYACVRSRVRANMRAYVHACVRACVRVCMYVCMYGLVV